MLNPENANLNLNCNLQEQNQNSTSLHIVSTCNTKTLSMMISSSFFSTICFHEILISSIFTKKDNH